MITDSINQARQMGASSDDILDEVYKQNPNLQGSIDSAKKMNANSDDILNEITKQNTPAASSTPQPSFFGNVMSAIGQGYNNNFQGAVQNVIGAGKGLLSTVKNASSLGEKIISSPLRLAGINTTKNGTAAEKLIPQSVTATTNTNQAIGKGAEQVAEYLVPGGLEEKAVTNANKLVKAGTLASKIATPLIKGAVSGASTLGVSALQGGNTKQNLISGALGGLAGGLSNIIGKAAPDLLNSLAKSSFRVTPTMEAKAATKINNAANFVTQNNLSLNPNMLYHQAGNITNKLEETLQSSLPETKGVVTENVINELNKIPEQFKGQGAIYQTVKKSVSDAITTLKETNPVNVSFKDLLSNKRSYGQAAFGKSSSIAKAIGNVSEGDAAIEQAFQNSLDTALKTTDSSIVIPKELQKYFGGKTEVSLGDFNKVYSQAISAKQFANLSRIKNDNHLVGRLFGLWAGRSVGNAILPGLGGEISGAAAGEILANKAPAITRQLAKPLIKSGTKLLSATKIGIGILNNKNNP